jgi:Uncharacterised nucleotidyltransferase
MKNELLRCLRWDVEGARHLRSLTAADWVALWALLQAGEGLHFLARRLRQLDVKASDEYADALRVHTMAIAAGNLRGRIELATLANAIGRPIMLLKGVDLADRLYGNLGLRPMGDIDFLVRRDDVCAYVDHLRAQGYTVTPEPEAAILNSPRYHHLVCVPEGPKTSLELHWRLNEEGTDETIDMEGIWERALRIPQFASEAFVMAPEDLFLHLCLHLSHHTFETSLTQIWDLAELIEAPHLPVDWTCALRRAHEWNILEAVRVALYCARENLGVSTDHISDWVPDDDLRQYLPDILQNLGRFPYSDQVAGHSVALLLSPQSNWGLRLEALRAVFPPRVEMRARYGRPDDSLIDDLGSMMQHWRGLFERKRKAISGYFRADSSVKAHVDRVAALRLRLMTHRRHE